MYNECETVINQMNSTGIKSFAIFNLFGRYNVTLKFDKEVNIYVGENGLGKTTILNCLYSVLNKKFSLLENVDFSKIEIMFKKNTSSKDKQW
jgi:predicted ATP-binding protein involved in virulence